MDTESNVEPWITLKKILKSEDAERLKGFLDSLPPDEPGRAISRLDDEEQAKLLSLIGADDAAHLVMEFSDTQAINLIEDLPKGQAAAIVDEMPSDRQADLLAELPAKDAEAILQEMAPEEASEARLLLAYPPHSAGGIMIREYLAYPDHLKISDVLDDLRAYGEHYSDYAIQYAYITSPDEKLVGVLRLRDLLLSRKDESVRSVMVPDPFSVNVNTPLEELQGFFDEHPFLGVPVTDSQGHLVGVVQRDAVRKAEEELANQTFLKLSGLRGDELRNMPLFTRSYRRLSWLCINILLNVVAASVIVAYQETLSAVIALAAFLPIISDMSGCSGNQAVAVSLRELTLGLLKPYEILRVLLKEMALGLITGPVIGGLLAGLALLWKGNPYLGIVVGGAMTLNTLVAVCLGGMLPLMLKRLKLDPALASAPLLTTVTDMCGFFFVLSFASALLPRLATP